MSEILSQSEIDALLAALTSGEVRVEDIRETGSVHRVRTYDFRRAMRFSKDHIRILSRMHEHFARLLTTHLSGQLRSVVQFQVESVDQAPYEEFIRSIPALTVVYTYAVPPLEGSIALEINPQIVFAMLDRLMGGQPRSQYKVRELTEIEHALLQRLFDRVPDFLQEAWRSVASIEPRCIGMESNPQFLQLVTANETVMVVTMSAKVGAATGLLNLCIPHPTVEPLLPTLTTQHLMDVSKNRRAARRTDLLEAHLAQVDVDVSVVLGEVQMTLSDILELERGDVLPLRTRVGQPVAVFVNEELAYWAEIGKKRDRYAVRIMRPSREVDRDGGQGREAVPGGN
ncbi:flagellar motor switch protein FliM [Alicyclobacillus cellulosilyticus]|uniref:Flagellar motor switch protein FliM n=1 Tax=Alicyclobacillus cellulosilyticus TaxID=1003997 RepID=A0A917JZI4_9BACL|nr:flagellar motor switch protein FliM [Alicyclobacillus cellulosilyticus]GGI94675.1 flagellar motor switch protein FliM [Alicyclobacillus cellulosilyticus]